MKEVSIFNIDSSSILLQDCILQTKTKSCPSRSRYKHYASSLYVSTSQCRYTGINFSLSFLLFLPVFPDLHTFVCMLVFWWSVLGVLLSRRSVEKRYLDVLGTALILQTRPGNNMSLIFAYEYLFVVSFMIDSITTFQDLQRKSLTNVSCALRACSIHPNPYM